MTQTPKAPAAIYLQYESDDCTWCVDQICDDDVKYIRADIAAQETIELKRQLAEAQRVCPNSLALCDCDKYGPCAIQEQKNVQAV